jgi:hypothetical protein
MLGCPGLFARLLLKLISANLTNGALLGSRIAFMGIAANGANKLFHSNFPPKINF